MVDFAFEACRRLVGSFKPGGKREGGRSCSRSTDFSKGPAPGNFCLHILWDRLLELHRKAPPGSNRSRAESKVRGPKSKVAQGGGISFAPGILFRICIVLW